VPIESLAVAGIQGVVTGIVFVAVSIIVGQLTVNLKRQIARANHREIITKTLYRFTRHISQTSNMPTLLAKITRLISKSFNLSTVIFLYKDNDLSRMTSYPRKMNLDDHALAAATWAWRNKKKCGKGTDTLVDIPWHFFLLQSHEEYVGLFGINLGETNLHFEPENFTLLQNLANQAANAIMHLHLAEEHEKNSLNKATERLKSALLSSVSHDLRTPLVTIKGTISGLLQYGDHYNAATQFELLNTAHEETERLDRYITNLLQMTKLATGDLSLNLMPSSIQDIIGNAINTTRNTLDRHSLSLNMPDNLPLINVDSVMTEQVFVNLLSNAVKYSPQGTEIKIQVMQINDKLQVTISDQGIGIASEDLEHIFDLFYRAKFADTQSGGSGMGLAICKGILEAEYATISAYSLGVGKGAVLTAEFPIFATTK
jgi:two-component system sensor histidine kinase KdpD